MTYTDTLNFIHSLDKFGSRPGLDRIKQLFDRTPEILDQDFIHVAGTNGKGSVCTMLSYILQRSGLKTGLFISPYITEFRERIQINNTPIAEKTLTDAVEYYRPILRELNDQGVIITEFEFLTAVAFYIFKEAGCDIVVCETGMGGLLDSTNLIRRPLCAVLTRIDLDHTAILGDTIEEIAAQKCGIIKDDSVTVTAAQDSRAMAVIKDAAAEKHNPLFLGESVFLQNIRHTRDGIYFDNVGTEMFLPLVGEHQLDNLCCALCTITALQMRYDLPITADSIRDGLAEVKHPARFERLKESPAVILDGAHNKNGLEAFARAVRANYPEGDKTLIVGMLADKDNASLSQLTGLFTRVIAVDVDNPRALPADQLARQIADLSEQIEVIPDPKAAFDKALAYGDDIFICGSLYLAGEIRPYVLSRT